MPIKTLGSLGKIRVGRVTGNTHIIFVWPYLPRIESYNAKAASKSDGAAICMHADCSLYGTSSLCHDVV